jgi:hypothetical protein
LIVLLGPNIEIFKRGFKVLTGLDALLNR